MSTHPLHLSPASVLSTLAVAGLVILLVHEFLAANTVRTAPVQPVILMAPPPAPAEEPPEVKKPEIEEVRPTKSLDNTLEWAPGSAGMGTGSGEAGPAATGSLGLDEAGGAGADAFGLAGKPGGRELLLTGGGGGGGNPTGRFVQFASQLQTHIARELNQLSELKKTCYRVNLLVRVSDTGYIEAVKIRKSSGHLPLDAAIEEALKGLPPMSAVPPSDMPWPVGLQVTSRRADCERAEPAHSPP